MPSRLAPHWMERQDLGQRAFLSLISVKFSFWKGRNGKDHICSAMVGGRQEKSPWGARVAASGAHRPLWKLLVLPPSALSPCCFPFPFFKCRDPGSPPFLQWCWSDGEVQDGAATFPPPCPFPPAPSPGLLSPASALLPTSHGTKAGPSWGPGDPSGLVWTQAGARLSLP